jgi:hypothetical protein
MSELQSYYDTFRQGYWATADADECPCHGRGWALSDVDTWHTCQIHFEGQLHPEACEGFEDEEDFLAAEEDSMKLFTEFQAARKAGTYRGNFDSFSRPAPVRLVSTLPAPAEESDEIPF